MSAKHTPGPWFNTSQDDTPMGEVMDQPLDSGVSLHISVSGPNAKADVRLIAAAPDMLAVLLKLRRGDLHQRVRPLYDEVQAAIAKATGSAS